MKIQEHCMNTYDVSNGKKKKRQKYGNCQTLQSKAQLSLRFTLCLTIKASGLFLLLLSKTSKTQTSPRNLQGLEQKSEGAQGGWNTVASHTWGMAIMQQGDYRNLWTFQVRHAWTATLQAMEWDWTTCLVSKGSSVQRWGEVFCGVFFSSSSEHFILKWKKQATSECSSSELICKIRETEYKSCTGNKITQLGLYDQHETPQIH